MRVIVMVVGEEANPSHLAGEGEGNRFNVFASVFHAGICMHGPFVLYRVRKRVHVLGRVQLNIRGLHGKLLRSPAIARGFSSEEHRYAGRSNRQLSCSRRRRPEAIELLPGRDQSVCHIRYDVTSAADVSKLNLVTGIDWARFFCFYAGFRRPGYAHWETDKFGFASRDVLSDGLRVWWRQHV